MTSGRVKKWDVDWDAPAALIDFAKLDADEIAVAIQIINLTYAQNDAPPNCPEDIKTYVKNMSRARCEKTIHRLIHKGVFFEEKGRLFSKKCQEILKKRTESFGKFSTAGKKSAEVRSQNKQNQGEMFNDVPNDVTDSFPSLPSSESKLHLPSVTAAPATPGSLKIFEALSEDGKQAARAAAPGWDIPRLGAVFDADVKSGRKVWPGKPDEAFPAWCKVYTGGRRP